MSAQNSQGKVIKCRAAVAWEPNKPLIIETVEVDPPKQGEVRIRIHYTAICHTEVFALEGNDPTLKFPIIPGHEAAGIVESVGPGVESVKPGDTVIPTPAPQCRKCEACLNPNTNICKQFAFGEVAGQIMDDGQTRFRCKGKKVFHFVGISTFSEYTVVREIAVSKINPKAPLDKVCLIGCGVTTGYGAPFNSCVVTPGSVAAVWGMGAIGLAAVMGCKAQDAKHVIAVDLNADRLQLAKKFGATDLVNPSELPAGKSLVEYFREKFNGGLDFAFEATGNPVAMAQAVECVKRATGQTCILGVSSQKIPLSASDLLMGRTVRGCVMGGFKPLDSNPMLVEKYLDGKLLLDEFISWRLPLEQINEGIEHLVKGQGIRSVITVAPE